MAKKQKRDANIPVLSFKIGDTRHDILIAGRGEFIKVAYKSEGSWSDCSIIDRQYGPFGLRETELHLHDPGFWGWMGRLIADGALDREQIKLLTQTDTQLATAN